MALSLTPTLVFSAGTVWLRLGPDSAGRVLPEVNSLSYLTYLQVPEPNGSHHQCNVCCNCFVTILCTFYCSFDDTASSQASDGTDKYELILLIQLGRFVAGGSSTSLC